MLLTKKRKAATLLMSLDAKTANELIKELPAERIQELAMELAQIESSGQGNTKEQVEVAREFCENLNKREEGFSIKGFLNEMLVNVLGREKAGQIQSQIRAAMQRGDPFIAIRSTRADELAVAIKEEHPQTIAVVLSELPPQKSQEVLALLGEETQTQTICKMTNLGALRPEVKQLIASTVDERLKSFKTETASAAPEKSEDPLRKLAVLLRGLEKDLKDRLLSEVGKKNKETQTSITSLMILWEDIPLIADRSLQEALRAVDSGKLALALYNSDEAVLEKIRANISERAKETLAEEQSLMQEPEKKEILEAREEVLRPLREANESGELKFTE